MCRGECSCILPIVPAAVHTNRTGSRLAIQHFTEYLQQFPKDLEVRWLLNVAHSQPVSILDTKDRSTNVVLIPAPSSSGVWMLSVLIRFTDGRGDQAGYARVVVPR